MVTYIGQGDARASMELLWGVAATPSRRGPKAELNVDMIVAAGLELADAGGLDQLSMRKIGDKLGRTPMALYGHLPSKAELIDLMWDRVLGELPTDYPGGSDWRVGIESLARDYLQLYKSHLWMLEISGARAGLGPNEFRTQETAATVLDGSGLRPRDMMRVFWVVSQLVTSQARALVQIGRASTDTGVSDESWWLTRSALVEELAPDFGERYPRITALSTAGAFDQESDAADYLVAEAKDLFELGLQLVLDGVQQLIDATGQPGPRD